MINVTAAIAVKPPTPLCGHTVVMPSHFLFDLYFFCSFFVSRPTDRPTDQLFPRLLSFWEFLGSLLVTKFREDQYRS